MAAPGFAARFEAEFVGPWEDYMIRFTQLLAGTTAALTAGALSIAAYAQEFTFSIHHFLSPEAPAQTMLLEPWSDAVEKASNGPIASDVFPVMTLGGTLPELPGVHIGDARATSLAIQDMMDDLAADFEVVHPILLPVHTYKDSA